MNWGKRGVWWLLFAALSVLLFAGYYRSLSHHELVPYLKGLTSLHHFFIHYSVGLFFGLLVIIVVLLIRHKRPNEPLILITAILISHAPDLRFLQRRLPHDDWEVIFLGHTVVDELPALMWVWLLGSLFLLVPYIRLIRQRNKTTDA